VGTVIDPMMSDQLRVTLVATGLGKLVTPTTGIPRMQDHRLPKTDRYSGGGVSTLGVRRPINTTAPIKRAVLETSQETEDMD
jgi:cell division GTPase FtsZ